MSANDGAIKISALENGGIIATGDDASANQAVETNKVLSVDTTWLNSWIITNIDGAGIVPGDGDIEIAEAMASRLAEIMPQQTKPPRPLARWQLIQVGLPPGLYEY